MVLDGVFVVVLVVFDFDLILFLEVTKPEKKIK